MEDKYSFKDFLNKQTSAESLFKRVPILLLLICALLVVTIFKIDKTNELLEIIADNNINAIEYEKFKDTFIEVETEDNETVEDYLPIVGELHEKDESTTKNDLSDKKETTTKQNSVSKNEPTTQNSNTEIETATKTDDNVARKTYVLNISSKKIHSPNCSFVPRTKEENKKTVKLSAEELNQYKDNGYTLCKTCGGK